MTFDDWMLTKDLKYDPTDDTVMLRRLRECWDGAINYGAAVRNAEVDELIESKIANLTEKISRRDAEVAELRQKLAAWIAENSPGGWIDNLRQQVTLLRGFVKLLRDYIPTSAVGNMTVQEALTTTEPKP